MVKSMDKAIAFYLSLGLTEKQRWGDHYAMLTTEGLTLGIHPSDKAENNSGTVSIGFIVESIEEAQELLRKNNIASTREDDGKSGLYLHFKDLDGTILYYVQPKW